MANISDEDLLEIAKGVNKATGEISVVMDMLSDGASEQVIEEAVQRLETLWEDLGDVYSKIEDVNPEIDWESLDLD